MATLHTLVTRIVGVFFAPCCQWNKADWLLTWLFGDRSYFVIYHHLLSCHTLQHSTFPVPQTWLLSLSPCTVDALWLFKLQILILPSALQSPRSHRPKLNYDHVWGKKTALPYCNCKQKSVWLYTHYTYIYSESNLLTLVNLRVS